MGPTLDVHGRWWLPEHADHQVPGLLTWNPETGGELRLHGELRPVKWIDNVLADGTVQKYREHRMRVDSRYPIIHGRSESQGYTLLDSFTLTIRPQYAEESSERVRVNRVLEGALFDGEDDLAADRANFRMRHLSSWVGTTGLSSEHPRLRQDGEDRFALVTARTIPTFSASHDGGSVQLAQWLKGTGDGVHALGVEQGWALRFVFPVERRMQWFIDAAGDFQDLATIGVGHTADFESVVVQHPDLPLLSLAGTPIGDARADINYYARWSARSDPTDPVTKHDMYFTFDDIGGVDGVGRWMVLAEHYRTELGRVMATRYSSSMYLEDRIMNVCASLDSFDRVRRDTGTHVDYVKRLEACIDLAGQPFLDLISQNPHQWARDVKELRHDLAHHRQRFRLEGSVGEHLVSEQLFWLFVMCMLRLVDTPRAAFESIANHQQIDWLKEQVSGADSL